MVGMLYKLKFYLPYRILKSIYHAFCHSNIQYFLIVQGSAHKASRQLEAYSDFAKQGFEICIQQGSIIWNCGAVLYHTVAKYQVLYFVFKVMKSMVRLLYIW
jgi:hypothetical protein